jgi:bis(5'-nucleosidyl)-tetraphosphatase
VANCVHPAKAGIIVLKQCGDTWLCLVLHARGEWALPKGFIEAGENSLAAAKREVAEETSLTQLDFRWGEVFVDTCPALGHEPARYYLASCDMPVFLPVSAELGFPEHDKYRWVSFTDARRLLPPRLAFVISWAEKTSRSTVPARNLGSGETPNSI